MYSFRSPRNTKRHIFIQRGGGEGVRVPTPGKSQFAISFLRTDAKQFVYKFERIVGKSNFSDQFKKIVKRYIRVGYNLDIIRQSVCLVLNPITVYSYGFLFNCTTVGQTSDSKTALT